MTELTKGFALITGASAGIGVRVNTPKGVTSSLTVAAPLTRKAATQAQIIEHCRPHLAAYKLPRSIRFVPDLPKTSTGKVMRRELKTLDRFT